MKMLFFLLAILGFRPAVAQETMYQVLDVMDLPPALIPNGMLCVVWSFRNNGF